jgi:hypothetical protein
VPAFTTSEEAFAAEELINAFRSGNAERITALIKPNSLYMNVDNQVGAWSGHFRTVTLVGSLHQGPRERRASFKLSTCVLWLCACRYRG